MKQTNAFADINVRLSGHLYDININRSAESWGEVQTVFRALNSSLSTFGHFNEFHLELSGPDHGIDITRRYGHSDHLGDLLYGVLNLLPRTPKVVAALPSPPAEIVGPVQSAEAPILEPTSVPVAMVYAPPIVPASRVVSKGEPVIVDADSLETAREVLFDTVAAKLLEPAHTKVDTAPASEVALKETAPICETCKQPKIKGKGRLGWYCPPCHKTKISAGMRKGKEERNGAPTVHTVDPRAQRATLSDLAQKDAIPAVPLTLKPAAPPSHILDMPSCSPWSDAAFQNAVVSGIATTAFARFGSFAIVKLLGHSHLTARHARSVQDSDTVVAMLDFNKTFRCWTAQSDDKRYAVPAEWMWSNAKS